MENRQAVKNGMTEAENIRIRLPESVKKIIGTLREKGHEAYAVGGCVRDSILGRTPEDWDITTSALPSEVQGIFRKTVATGIEHGTVTVLLKDGSSGSLSGFEVTTYRVDGAYQDGRHPESVRFTPSLSEDLRRRDFTINAMAYSDEAGLVDVFGGVADLRKGIISCVGDPNERFSEDALRILRAVRFSAQLGFRIDAGTERAIKGHVQNLLKVSRERIQAELSKLLCSAHPERVSDLFRLSMDIFLCPGFSALRRDVFEELQQTAEAPEAGRPAKGKEQRPLFPELPLSEKYLRYAMLLSDGTSEDAVRLMRGLRLDNDTISRAEKLVQFLYKPIPAEPYALKKVMQQMSPELFRTLLLLKRQFSGTARYRARCRGEEPDQLLKLLSDIIRREEPVYLSDLIIKGKDLLAAGMKPGPEIGSMLSEMLDDVQQNPVHNSVLYLLSRHLCGQGYHSEEKKSDISSIEPFKVWRENT